MAGEKVLLVDDEKEFVAALSERLELRDMRVDSAGDGKTALEKASAKKYDIIILDLAMPGMDGIETLRELKKGNPDLHVILLTGRGSLQKSVEAMKLGAMDFLEKPADINLLMEKIKTAKTENIQMEIQKTDEVISEILKTKGW